jgi:hypothetical protein
LSGFPFQTPKPADTAFLPGDDPRFLDALADFEAVTIAYLGTLP